ncbi:MAG: hypothetical protein ACRDPE_06945 [Solirubrobacterales bacterium]
MRSLDLAEIAVRDLNEELHRSPAGRWEVLNPAGRHAVAVGMTVGHAIDIRGHVGYYCAGMNQEAEIFVHGTCGVGVAENMMSGKVVVEGDASQAAGASAHGGLLVIGGNAAARCGISLKGADIVVRGSVGHATGFMSQSGSIVVCGDAGEALGDSIYEARIYVRGEVAGLGADCVAKDFAEQHRLEVGELLDRAGLGEVDPGEFLRYGSARRLYNFDVDDAGDY